MASFFEPGSADEVASQLRLWEGEVVVALGGPSDPDAGERSCDAMLAGLGVAPTRASPELAALAGQLGAMARFTVEDEGAGTVGDGAYTDAPLIETSPTACSARCRTSDCRPAATRSVSRCASRS